MSFIAFIVTFTIFMMVVMTSSSTKMTVAQRQSRAQRLFTSKHPKPSLRSRSHVAENESPIIKMYGYFEMVIYANDDCTDAAIKTVIGFNICTLSADPEHSGQYLKATVYAYPDYNYYEIDAQHFSDSACTSLVSTDTLTYPILICDNGQLDHVIPQPLSPTGDNLGFSYLLYDSQTDCINNNYQVGVTEAQYARFGLCLPGDSSSATADFLVESCTSTQIVVKSYTSTDGSCTGTETTDTLTSSNFCNSGTESLVNNYYGYKNFGCAISPY